jgi:hypothetical protein
MERPIMRCHPERRAGAATVISVDSALRYAPFGITAMGTAHLLSIKKMIPLIAEKLRPL